MNGNPTKKQKDFHKWCIEELGCVINEGDDASLHHIKGTKANLKGVKGFGEWYVLPLSYWWHQDGRNKAARHINKMLFEFESGGTEKYHWIMLIKKYEEIHCRKPMSEEEYQIIVDRA